MADVQKPQPLLEFAVLYSDRLLAIKITWKIQLEIWSLVLKI